MTDDAHCRFFEKSPEAVQLFDGEGDLESAEFIDHATRVMTRIRAEMEHLDDHDSDSSDHDHGDDVPLTNTTPEIREVYVQYTICMILVPIMFGCIRTKTPYRCFIS